MRPRISNKVNVNEIINEIDRRIEVKKELVYLTSRINKCSFSEAKKDIKWEQIKTSYKLINQ